jgi:hypothetical protein
MFLYLRENNENKPSENIAKPFIGKSVQTNKIISDLIERLGPF